MKSIRDYIAETDRKISNPVTGDVVSFVVNESLAIECDVVEHGDDYIVIEADEITESVLVESECTMERIARYGATGSNRGQGFSMSEDYDQDEYDEEGEMAKSQARTIKDAAQDIENMLGDDENLPEWVQGKITKAADYIDTARDYLKSNRPEITAEGVMSDIDIDLHNIARSEDFDMLYDAFNGKMGGATQSYLENMFAKVAQHNRLHPDDQQEDILEIMMDQIVTDYGDGDIDTPAEPAQPVAEDFMSRMLELAGCKRMEEEANTTDPLAAKAASLAPVGADGDTDPVTTVDEDGVDPVNAAGMDAEELSGNMTAEAEYQGRDVKLGKPMKGDVRKFKVYVKDPKTGNVKKVNFGDPNMEIRRDDPKRRKSFRARHGCGTPRASDRTKAAYWSCRMWSKKPVSKIV